MPETLILFGRSGWHPLQEGEQCVGRSSQCQITLPDNTVSRRHARIVVRNGAAFVSDSDSHNGTFLNDLPVRGEVAVPLMGRLRFGQVVLQLTQTSSIGSACDSGCSTRDWRRDPPPVAGLTEFEHAVFRLLLTPLNEKEIAQQLVKTRDQVHNAVRRIFAKFGVKSRPELMSLFIEPDQVAEIVRRIRHEEDEDFGAASQDEQDAGGEEAAAAAESSRSRTDREGSAGPESSRDESGRAESDGVGRESSDTVPAHSEAG